MYIWIGIDVDSQLNEIKEKAREIEDKIGFDHSNFTLPLHISLKISFPIEAYMYERVTSDIIGIFDEFEPFSVDVRGIELDGTICWIMMQRNSTLDALHDRLNSVLLQKYGVPLHEYDMDYKFHTTLFMDNNADKIASAYGSLGDVTVPASLVASKFVIGTSESGALGTYKVVIEIEK